MSQRLGSLLDELKDVSTVYQEKTLVDINGISFCIYPYGVKSESSSEAKEVDYVVSHDTPQEEAFGGSFLEPVETYKKWFCGHIHLKKLYREGKLFILGVPIPTRNLETSNAILSVEKNRVTEIEVPEFLKIETVDYSIDPSELNKDWIYNINNAPNYNSVFDKFSGYNIREEGISVKESELLLEETKAESITDLKTCWSKFCLMNNISKEVFKYGVDVL